MSARLMALGLIVASVFATGAKCSPKALDSLEGALRSQSDAGADLLDEARSATNLSGLSAEDLARQRRLLAQTDERILTSVATTMDNTALSARHTAAGAAEATASSAVTGPVPPQFLQDLKDITKELVEEQACQAVLDLLAPAPEEPGRGQTWTDLVGEVVDRMVARRWDRPPDRWDRFVAWSDYVAGTAEDADRLAGALLADPSRIELFARPPVQRAALAYARFCYDTPRLP